MDLSKFQKEVHDNAVSHGWHEEKRTFGDIIALCHCELSEAMEEYRNEKPNVYFVKHDGWQGDPHSYDCTDLSLRKNEKLEGQVTELADCVIRILDYCASINVDLAEVMQLKHDYNKTRSYKHGGKVI